MAVELTKHQVKQIDVIHSNRFNPGAGCHPYWLTTIVVRSEDTKDTVELRLFSSERPLFTEATGE